MTKTYFKELAAYNVWANTTLGEWITAIDDAQWNQEVVSSFASIAQTVLHIISAENIWLQRLKKENTVWLQSEYQGSKPEHIALLIQVSKSIKRFIDEMDETILPINLDFKRINGTAYSMPHYQLLAHLFNHSTYHRGQLVTLFRQVGFSQVRSTDLLAYYRIN